jgi:hypothetical protein
LLISDTGIPYISNSVGHSLERREELVGLLEFERKLCISSFMGVGVSSDMERNANFPSRKLVIRGEYLCRVGRQAYVPFLSEK